MKSLKLILPSLAAGGLLFGSALSGAQPAPPAPPPTAPAKPATPAKPPGPPPKAPKAPKPPAAPAIPVKQIEAQVQTAIDAVKNNPHIPKDVRDSIVKRLTGVRGTVGKRLSNIDLSDMDKFEEQMEKFGEEIEKEMEGLDEEMEKLGEQLGKDLAKNFAHFGNIRIGIDVDDDIDDVQIDVDDDDDDIADKIDDLKGVALNPNQRHAIAKLRIDSDKAVETAKLALQDANKKLDAALANPNTPDAEIARLVDQVSAQEATIRKTRILAWSQARRVLDDAQRKKIEDAAKKKTK